MPTRRKAQQQRVGGRGGEGPAAQKMLREGEAVHAKCDCRLLVCISVGVLCVLYMQSRMSSTRAVRLSVCISVGTVAAFAPETYQHPSFFLPLLICKLRQRAGQGRRRLSIVKLGWKRKKGKGEKKEEILRKESRRCPLNARRKAAQDNSQQKHRPMQLRITTNASRLLLISHHVCSFSNWFRGFIDATHRHPPTAPCTVGMRTHLPDNCATKQRVGCYTL